MVFRLINQLKVFSDIPFDFSFQLDFLHNTIGDVNLFLVVSSSLADDLELFYEYTEKNCIGNCVGDIDLNHYEQLSVCTSIDFDKHEGYGRIVPHGKILVQEQSLCVIILHMSPRPGLIYVCRSQLRSSDYCSKVYSRHPLFAGLQHIPHYTGNDVGINYK